MLKQPEPTLHKTTRTEITSLFGNPKLVLEETLKAISPFGGRAGFISFLGQIRIAREVQQHLPFAEPTSNNAIPLAHALTAFLRAVVVGAQRFAHGEWLRADRVLHGLLGLERFPLDDTIRNFFLRFAQGRIEAFWRPRLRWPAAGWEHRENGSKTRTKPVGCHAAQRSDVIRGSSSRISNRVTYLGPAIRWRWRDGARGWLPALPPTATACSWPGCAFSGTSARSPRGDRHRGARREGSDGDEPTTQGAMDACPRGMPVRRPARRDAGAGRRRRVR